MLRSTSTAFLLPILLASTCAKRVTPEVPVESRLEVQQRLAAAEGVDQTLQRARLASFAMADGDDDLAFQALRQMVGPMQDFRADGQFRALVGAERSKEWKGDPYEKMMAFLYFGVQLYGRGDYGNALAMTKSAILSDTGTTRMQYRADFVPAFVLQALAHGQLGQQVQAQRSIEQGIDALYVRALTDHLAGLLSDVSIESDDPAASDAARVLLLAGLPAGLFSNPRDLEQAISGALSRATDLRQLVIEGKRRDRPPDLALLRTGPTKRSLPHFEPLVLAWRDALAAAPTDPTEGLDREAHALRQLIDDPPAVLLWVESGRGPVKVNDGRWGEILRIQARSQGAAPDVSLDGHSMAPAFLDSVTWQAQTRGSRAVDGFLKGKAVFKDVAPALGWVLFETGNIVNATRSEDQDSTVGTVLAVVGAVTFIAGVVANPQADTRTWMELPDTLWLVRADPTPGDHQLTVGDRSYTLQVPDTGTVVQLIPHLAPGGPSTIGTPCTVCQVPLALPSGTPPTQRAD